MPHLYVVLLILYYSYQRLVEVEVISQQTQDVEAMLV